MSAVARWLRMVRFTGLARSVRLLVVAVLALALTGCLRYQVDLTVGADERVSGTVIFAIKTNDPNIAQTGGIPEDLSDKVTSRRYNKDGYLGEQLTLDGLTFDEVERLFDSGSRARGAGAGSGPGATPGPRPSGLPIPSSAPTAGPTTGAPSGSAAPTGTPGVPGAEPANRSTFDFRRDGDQVRVEGLTTFPFFASQNVQQGFEAKITLTFPGDIVSTNGTKNGRSVTWTVSPTKPTQISVVANLTDKQPAWVLYALSGGGAAVVLVLIVLVAWMVRRRRAAVPDGAAPVFDAAEFQTFLDDGGWYPSGYPAEQPPQQPPPGGGAPPWGPPPGQAPQQVPAGPGLGVAPTGPPAPPSQQPPAYPPQPPPAYPPQPPLPPPAYPPQPPVPPGYGPPPGYPPQGPPPQGPPPPPQGPPPPPPAAPPYPPAPDWQQGGPGPAPWPPGGQTGGPPPEQQSWPQGGGPVHPPQPEHPGLSGPPVAPDQEWRPPYPEKS